MNLYTILRRDGFVDAANLESAAAKSTEVGEQMSDDIRWIRSYVIGEKDGGLGTVCIYQASSEDAIRRHANAADLSATGERDHPYFVDERPADLPGTPFPGELIDHSGSQRNSDL